MEEKNKPVAEQPKRFTYEELENIAGNLSMQVQKLKMQLHETNMINTFKRLDYCFKVLEVASAMFSPDFIERCAKEIEELMTPPASVEQETEEK